MTEAPTAEREALRQCLLVMAGADTTLTVSEVETVAAFYAEASGRPIDPRLISDIFMESRSCDAEKALADLQRIAGTLDEATKERIVKACYSVMVADNKIDRRETQRLSEILEALNIAPDKRSAWTR